MIGYEYYYLFGLDIPLNDYGLGVIKQPKLIDYISKDISIENFYLPFFMNDVILSQIEDVTGAKELRDTLGELTFLLMNCYQAKKDDILNLLKQSLSLLYNTDSVNITKDLTIEVDDIVIDNKGFEVLSKVVLDIFKIDKSKMKFDKEEELDPVMKRLEMLRKQHKENTKSENESLSMIDILNIIIHSNECSIDYDKVINMTVYQIKNTFETLSIKENYAAMIQYKLSQKYDVKEDVENWYTKKIVKNSSLIKDV